MGQLHIVVGGQFGSEGKGHVAHRLIARSTTYKGTRPASNVYSVRVGGPNAGHTVYDADGNLFALRQLPVGAITPGVICVIAQGSEVDLRVLQDELVTLRGYGHTPTILISDEATVIIPAFVDSERQWTTTGNWVASTSKGIGAARSARIWRQADRIGDLIQSEDEVDGICLNDLFKEYQNLLPLYDSSGSMLNRVHAERDSVIVIEGTQGYGLGLHSGFYPNTTSTDCRAIDVLAQAGLSPWVAGIQTTDTFEVWICVRPNPIRIAGDSGPLLDETTWEALGLQPELTTVTRKVRRVGAWDPQLVADAVRANGGPSPYVRLVLTMADHLIPAIHGMSTASVSTELLQELGRTIRSLQASMGGFSNSDEPLFGLATTGPDSGIWL